MAASWNETRWFRRFRLALAGSHSKSTNLILRCHPRPSNRDARCVKGGVAPAPFHFGTVPDRLPSKQRVGGSIPSGRATFSSLCIQLHRRMLLARFRSSAIGCLGASLRERVYRANGPKGIGFTGNGPEFIRYPSRGQNPKSLISIETSKEVEHGWK